jgi:hypothetical protein
MLAHLEAPLAQEHVHCNLPLLLLVVLVAADNHKVRVHE